MASMSWKHSSAESLVHVEGRATGKPESDIVEGEGGGRTRDQALGDKARHCLLSQYRVTVISIIRIT